MLEPPTFLLERRLYLGQQNPHGSPPCWGKAYEEGNSKGAQECRECPFNFSCKSEYSQAIGRAAPQQQQWGWNGWGWQGMAPPTPPTPPRLPVIPTTPPPPPNNNYTRPQMGYNNSGPSWSPDQFSAAFGQHPSETTGERLVKNIILKALEAVFTELARFFHFWPWPKKV